MKPIKLTQSSIAKAKEAVLNKLDGLKLQGTKVEFSYDFAALLKEQLASANIKKPIVYMTAATYLKMLQYVLTCDVEIAWHGTVQRGTEDKKHIFYIKDVYLYPQKIAAATVQVDDDKYTQWSDQQDDETFNNRRFQGHSHVNMAAFYSGTDQANKDAFLQDLLEDDYYIFLVMNKKQDLNWEVYDLAQNVIFEKEDIDFRVYMDQNTVMDIIKDEIEKNCAKQTYPTNNNYPRASGYASSFDYHSYGFDNYFEYTDYLDNRKPGETPQEYKNRIKASNKAPQAIPYKESIIPTSKKALTVDRFVVLLDRKNRDFETEHREYIGEVLDIRFNGKTYECFAPYTPFTDHDIKILRKQGWHVRNMPVPEDFNLI